MFFMNVYLKNKHTKQSTRSWRYGSARALADQAEAKCVVPITHVAGHNYFRLQFKKIQHPL